MFMTLFMSRLAFESKKVCIVRTLVPKRTLNHLAKVFHLRRFYSRTYYAYFLLKNVYFQKPSHYLRTMSLVLRKVNIIGSERSYRETKFRHFVRYLGI